MIAHLGHPGAREYVQVLAVFSVSSGNPGAMEPTLYSSSLFNMIVHLVITGAREIVKTTVVNSVAPGIPDAMEPTLNSSFLFNMIVHLVNTGTREIVKSPVASGNPDAMEPSLSSSLAEHVPSHLSPLKSNNGSSHLQATSHYKATLHPWPGHIPGCLILGNPSPKLNTSDHLSGRLFLGDLSPKYTKNSNTWLSHTLGDLSFWPLFWLSNCRRPTTNYLQSSNHLVVSSPGGHSPLQPPGRLVSWRPLTHR